MKILLSGCTGFIGRHLARELSLEGHELVSLTRRKEYSGLFSAPNIRYATWKSEEDPFREGLVSLVEWADGVVNLAGESMGKGRWSAARKQVLVDSRIQPTRALARAIKEAKKKPEVLINSSAVGYYGNVDDGDVTEEHQHGEGFLASLCREWEEAARKVEAQGVRLVLLRTAFVVGGEGSPLGIIARPFRLFVGGPIGTGRQWFPWVHVEDVTAITRFALSHDSVRGPLNVAAPEAVDMRGFCATLGRALGRPSWAPVPGFAVRIVVGEMADMILGGQKVVPRALERYGFIFKYPTLSGALNEVYDG